MEVGDKEAAAEIIAEDLQNAGYGKIIRYADKLASHIAGHSDYHGNNILSAIYVLADGRDIKDVRPLNLEEIREQAIREFAENIQNQLNNILKKFKPKPTDNLTQAIYNISNKIDDLIKEWFGWREYKE